VKHHKDKGLRITEEDLESLRASKHEQNLQRLPPRKRRRAKKAAERRSDVGQEQMHGKKENLERKVYETKEGVFIKELDSKRQVEEIRGQELDKPKASGLKSESNEPRQLSFK